MVASGTGGLVFIIAFIALALMQAVVAIGSWFASAFLNAIEVAKDENKDNINSVLASSANEMLGTNLDAGDLAGGSGAGSSMQTNEAIGDALLNIFEQAFGGGNPVSPEQGAVNARKFAGWAVSFATTQGFLSILTEATSLGFLKEFHELPDGLVHSLGIGRLQRLALQPLIQDAVQKPYQRFTMSQYRPTRIAEAQLVRGLRQGTFDQDYVTTALQELGYPDDQIEFLLSDLSVKLGLSELFLLLNNGDVSEQDVINNLTMTGMPEDQAKLQLKAADLAAAKTQQMALLTEVENAYVAGFISQDLYNSTLSNLSLSDLEEQNFRKKVGFKQEVPRKTLTFAEVEAAIIENIVDFSYLDQWFTGEGYDPQAQLVLTFSVLQKIKTAEDKQSFARYKAAVLRAANKPVPPWITTAETAV